MKLLQIHEYVNIAVVTLNEGYFYSEIDMDELEEILYDFFSDEHAKKVQELKDIVAKEDVDRTKSDQYYMDKVKEVEEFMMDLVDQVSMSGVPKPIYKP